MKLPFRSRASIEDFDFDELDDVGFEEIDDLGGEAEGEFSDPVEDVVDDDEGRVGSDAYIEPEPDPELDVDLAQDLAELDGEEIPGVSGGAVSADEFSSEMERLRSEASAEQRSAWAYLGVLGGVFLLLVLFGYVLSDERGSETVLGTDGEAIVAGEPSRLVLRIDGDVITLEGTLPDEASKAQLLTTVEASYGVENILDELVVDETFSLENGTIRMVGSATFGDERPEALQAAVSSDFGLANRGFEVGFVETVLAPVNALVEVADGRVVLSGTLPDQQSIDDLVGLAASVWGPTNVDAALITIGETTWTDGRIRLTGTAVSTDGRIDSFVDGVPERIDATVAVETGGLVVNDITQLVTQVQTQINALVAASPITFAPLSAEIEPVSDPVLVEVATLVNSLVETPFEVVGHTDNVGDDQENLVLSQDRAQAVLDRLVELGVAAERMSSRGEGESKPVGDNNTNAGRSANRRIEFVLVGTSGG